jgi:Holliday junction resolvase RusA-like endonuclease
MTFEVFVEGTPVPQGSKSISRSGVMYEANKNLKPWRKEVTAAASRVAGTNFELMQGPLIVSIWFTMPRPPTVKRESPSVKPDLDKMCRAVLDSLSGIVYKDDAQIIRIDAIESYESQTGAHIFVHHADTMRDDVHEWLQRNRERKNK